MTSIATRTDDHPSNRAKGTVRADGRARGRIWIERGSKPVRAYLGGERVADTADPTLAREAPYYPAYYLPRDSMVAWFVEDEEVFTHPRNSYTRVDILASSRHVRVDDVDGIRQPRPTIKFT